MNSLSREKRVVHNLYKDYLSTEDLIPFIQSNKYRCNFSDTVYPAFKKDMCKFFQGKDYWPETHIKNPKSDGVWYVKPNKGSHGEGITITDNVSSIDDSGVIYQRSVENLLLHEGRKQDIRVYVALQTYGGHFRSYIYYEGYCKVASFVYDKNNLDTKIQLTNFTHTNNTMQKFTDNEYYYEMYSNIKNIVLDFSNDIYNKINNNTQRNLIHIFGFDFIPDTNKKTWLLEVNDNPQVVWFEPTIKTRLPVGLHNFGKDLMEELFKELIYPMKNNTDVKPNNFELVHEKELLFNKWIFV